jgi:DNA-binding NtrC family response regulator
MTIRVFCRWIGEHALRGIAKAADGPALPMLSARETPKVLAICPRDHDHLLLRMAAFQDGWDLSLVRSFGAAMPLLRRGGYSIILYDADLPSPDLRNALERLTSPAYDRLVILLSRFVEDRKWQRAMELGAFAVLQKPVIGSELLAAVSDARHILAA